MECESKSDTCDNWGNWNHFKINQTILEQQSRKARIYGTKKSCEITLYVAQIVNTEQIQHSIP